MGSKLTDEETRRLAVLAVMDMHAGEDVKSAAKQITAQKNTPASSYLTGGNPTPSVPYAAAQQGKTSTGSVKRSTGTPKPAASAAATPTSIGDLRQAEYAQTRRQDLRRMVNNSARWHISDAETKTAMHSENNIIRERYKLPYDTHTGETFRVREDGTRESFLDQQVKQEELHSAAERAVMNAERRRNQDYAKQTPLSVWGHNTMAGLAGIQNALYATADFILPNAITPKPVQDYMERAKENSADIVSKVRDYNYERGGAGGGMAGDLYQSGVQMIPHIVLTLLTGGASEAATAAKAMSSVGMGSVGKVAQQLASTPAYWSSFVQTIGTDYEENLQNGASEIEAAIAAIISSAGNAGIEVGGGFETMDARSGLRGVLKSAAEEGAEEVKQGVVSNLTQKAIYDGANPYFSMDRDGAGVVNPLRAADEFGGGAVLGLVASGGRTVGANLYDRMVRAASNEMWGEAGDPYAAQQETASDANTETDAGKEARQGGDTPPSSSVRQGETPQAARNAPGGEGALRYVDAENQSGAAVEGAKKGSHSSAVNAADAASTFTPEATDTVLPIANSISPDAENSKSKMQGGSEAARRGVAVVPGSTMGRSGVDAMLQNMPEDGADTALYSVGFHAYYEAGLAAVGLDNVRSVYDGALTEEQKKAAYYAGGKDYLASLETDKQNVSHATVFSEAESGVMENEYAAKMDATEKTAIDYLAKSLGVKVEIVPEIAEGRANGSIRDGVIQLAPDEGDPIAAIALHELTHRLQQLAPAEYRGFRDYAVGRMLANEFAGETAQTLVEAYTERYGGTLTTEQAFDEIAADYAKRLLTDRAAADQFIRDDRSRAQKFFDTLKAMIKDLTAYIEGLTGKAKTYADERLGEMKKGYEMWREAFKAADAEVKTRREISKNSGQDDAAHDTLYSKKSYDVHLKKQEYAQVLSARMQKYGGIDKSAIPAVDYIFAHDRFYVVENYSIDAFRAMIRLDPAVRQGDTTASMEVLGNESVRNHNGFVDAYETVRRNRRRRDGNSGSAGNRGTAGENVGLVYGAWEQNAANGKSNSHGGSENSGNDGVNSRGTRFSMKEPVEEGKNLVALHNLSEDKLKKSLALGGFPMPSIAVTKADIPHDNFGDISLVFGKDTVDPKANRKNTVYSADAWTPTVPQTEYEADKKAMSRISGKFYGMAKEYGYEFLRPLQKYVNGMEDELRRADGEAGLLARLRDDTGMMRVFLADTEGVVTEGKIGRGEIDGAAYEKWLDALFSGVEKNAGIYNGKDIFTPSGNRRTFSQTHLPATLSNIAKVMAAQNGGNSANVSGFYGIKSLRAGMAERFRSVADMHKLEDRLQNMTQEQLDAVNDALNARLMEIASALIESKGESGNRFMQVDSIGETLMEVAESKKCTVDNIVNTFAKYGYKVGNGLAAQIRDLLFDTAQMPVNLFEAKPARAVGFDEVRAAVVPQNIDPALRDELEARGIQILTYDPEADGDRLRAVQSIEDVRFSRGSGLERTVKKQQNTIDALREQFHRTKYPVADRKAAAQIASEVTREYGSKYAKTELVDELRALSETVLENRDKDGGFATAKSEAVEVAHKILAQSEALNDTTYREYAGLRKYVRETAVTLSEADRSDLAAAGGYDTFRKSNFGRMKLTDGGMPVDTLYSELHESYGDGLFPADITHPADQLMQIAEVLQSVQAAYENPYSGYLREAADMLADELIDSLTAAPRQVTYADKQAAKLDDVRAEYRQKARDAVARERAKREDRIAEVKEYYQKRVRDVRTIRDNRELRVKIQKHVKGLSDRLIKPTDTKHIPEGLRKPVAEFLSAIDLTSSRAAVEPSRRTLKLQALKDAYERIGKEEDGDYALIDPDLADNMQEILDLKGKSVSDFNKVQLETLYKVVLAVNSSVRNANRVFSEGKYKAVSELGDAFILENGERKSFAEKYGARPVDNLLNMEMLRPFDYFHELGESGEAMYAMLRRAMDKKITRTKQLQDFSAEMMDGVDAKEWSGGKARAAVFHTAGGDISLTPAQVMSLYKLLSREQARDHIFRGGVLQGKTVVRNGKHGRAVSKSYDPVHITLEDAQKIVSTLTAEQKRVADKIGAFMSTTLSDWGNEVSMELYGYRKFNEAHYFPIRSDAGSIKTELAQGKDSRVKSMGFTKATVKKANNAVILDDIFDVFAEHADDMSTYNAFAPALEDVQRVYNYRRFTAMTDESGIKYRQENGTVKRAISRTMGDRGNTYFKQLMKNLNEGIRASAGSEIAEKLLSRYKGAAVGLNLRVIVQQPTALARAAAFIDPKYLAKGLAMRGDFSKVKAYAPIAQWKDWGYFQFDTGRKMKDIILGNRSATEWMMAGAGLADNVTWAHLWNAVEAETKDKTTLQPGSEAFYKACGERFAYLIDRTQVVDSILHRSQTMRSGNTLVKMATSFMAEPTMSYNLLRTSYRDALTKGGSAARKQAGFSTMAFLASATLTAMAAGLVDALRDDDDNETYLQKLGQAVTGIEGDEENTKDYALGLLSGNLGDNLNPLNMIPFAKDIMSMLQGYEVKRMDMTAISDTMRAAGNVEKAMNGTGKYTLGYALTEFALKAGKLLGFSGYNLKRELEGMANTVINGLETLGVDTAGARFRMDETKYSVDSNKNRFIEQLYEAEQTGDTALSDLIHTELLESGVSEDEINRALRQFIKDEAGVQKAPAAGSAEDDSSLLDGAREAGLTMDDYVKVVRATAALTGIKDANGKTVADSLGLRKMQAVNEIGGLDDAQRRALYAYVGVGSSIMEMTPDETQAALSKMETMHDQKVTKQTQAQVGEITRKMEGSKAFSSLSDTYQQAALDAAGEYVSRVMEERMAGRPLDGWVEKAAQGAQAGLEPYEYILFQAAVKAVGTDGSTTQDEVIGILNDMDELKEEEKYYLFRTRYTSDKNNPFYGSAAYEKAEEASASGFVNPVKNTTATVTSTFGNRLAPKTSGGSGSSNHKGVDIGGKNGNLAGEAVCAVGGGTVVEVNKTGYGGGYGTYIKIDHENGYTSLYGHMIDGSADGLNVGDTVNPGQSIGKIGATGNSGAPHLHLEMCKNGVQVDPAELIPGWN